MKKLFIFLFIFINFVIQSQPITNTNSNQRNLTIALDPIDSDFYINDNDKTTFTGHNLLNGIKSKKSFIITNYYVFENYITCCNLFNEEIINFEDWEIFKNDDFLLLIPKQYKEELNDDLGLNFGIFKQLKETDFYNLININTLKKAKRRFKYNLNFLFRPFVEEIKSNNFIKLIDKIFDNQNNLEWNICLTGHGNYYYVTCGIVEDSFKKFLNILENKIKTRTFIYKSCFAGGKMLDFIYEKNKYHFLILCQCLTDSYSYSHDNDQKILNKISELDINNLEAINKFIDEFFINEFTKFDIHNLPIIRMPNYDSFIVPEIENKITSITENSTKEKLENLKEKVVLINTPIIKNTIKITDENEYFLSFLKGDAYHYIEKIESDHSTFSEIADTFWFPYYPQKIFLIKEIECIKKLSKDNEEKKKYENVILFINSFLPNSKFTKFDFKSYSLFYILDGEGYVGYKKISKELKDKYLKIFDKIKKNIETGKQSTRFYCNDQMKNLYMYIKHILKISEYTVLPYFLCKSLMKIKDHKYMQIYKDLAMYYSLISLALHIKLEMESQIENELHYH